MMNAACEEGEPGSNSLLRRDHGMGCVSFPSLAAERWYDMPCSYVRTQRSRER